MLNTKQLHFCGFTSRHTHLCYLAWGKGNKELVSFFFFLNWRKILFWSGVELGVMLGFPVRWGQQAAGSKQLLLPLSVHGKVGRSSLPAALS